MKREALTKFNDEYKQKYGWDGWDDPRPQAECRMCKGTGRASGDITDPNECGFCYPPTVANEQPSNHKQP